MVCVQDPSRMFLAGCSAYKCSYCGPLKVQQVVDGMGYVQLVRDRTRFITLTQAPESFDRRRQRMADLARWMKQQGYRWQVAWTTEKGSTTGMTHIHALQWGDYIPQADLQNRWGHIVDIRGVKDDARAVGQYMAKGSQVARYMAKGAREAGYAQYLALNQGRPIRWTREFFGGLTPQEAARLYKSEHLKRPLLDYRIATPDEARVWMDNRNYPATALPVLLTGDEPGLY